MKIALAQIDTVLGNKRKNLLKIENLCSKAAKENVDIICFPELARIIALKGADIIFLPSAWHKEAKDIWTINCASRALENGIHLAAVNRCGKEENLHFFGGSQLIGARGQTLKLANYNSEELIFCEVDFNEQSKTRLEIPYLRHRRTDIYSIEYTDKNEY
ncbi:nitrilase-related carbon-nitrogen hydrolase (plasmid) [Arsenophonus nasoniae]|uniref:2-oxoglutaramate amidase n=1 Tax=Arsenophonus nasoniae TaxID=638 RepID=A0A4P7L5P5_9GAMM|nr:nitrilase-related carbon-nitrogen hydrolase [Arsenophonus nasoniae]QBY45614.1 2-oxoglutaramate amidase [Arsenophonus nasoniae]WGM07880.1 nitrilase-related carbon-nitrogen hydrolase [Arsenophonus nasoniae]WGM12973.1 nitrilase-related carbon-nitrogen hydrolase [Arsenophonus nasoniae]WGM17439.1 nitrilase-related carbon-nitrogen hydrolase [Arsenophonus nasoniae]